MQIVIIALMMLFVGTYPTLATVSNVPKTGKPLVSKTIAIDPGHGGYDPGATWMETREKDINLVIAKSLEKHLEGEGAKVVLTRSGDYNHAIVGLHGRDAKRYDLNQRIAIAERYKADILVTIHVNSVPSALYRGAEAFYYPDSEKSKILAEAIQEELRSIPGMYKRIAKTSTTYLLRNTKMPAVLVEVGYLSNPNERRLLQDPGYQDILARKMAAGIVRYFVSPPDRAQ